MVLGVNIGLLMVPSALSQIDVAKGGELCIGGYIKTTQDSININSAMSQADHLSRQKIF